MQSILKSGMRILVNKRFRVLVNGTNFLIELDGSEQKCGFYATRYVEAENEELAETKVIEAFRTDRKLVKLIRNESNDSPALFANEIEKVEMNDSPDEFGFAWYLEKTSN